MTNTLQCRSGSLSGVRIGDVVHYRGIPYAQAGRFEPARAVAAWEGVRDASQHGPICPQLPSPIRQVMGVPSEAAQDEACLTLSVSTPVASAPPRTVMVWFHGGAYVVGASSYEWYRPDALVHEGDVVVVSVNYRIGLFGYLHLPGVSPGNLGLLDQLAALRWVQDNIAAFGGDPSAVTVFGESAGGTLDRGAARMPERQGAISPCHPPKPAPWRGFYATGPRASRRQRAREHTAGPPPANCASTRIAGCSASHADRAGWPRRFQPGARVWSDRGHRAVA